MSATLLNLHRKVLLLLVLVLGLSTLLGVFLLNRDHGWGDDFAAYLMQAQSIVRGDMRGFVEKSTFTLENSSYIFAPVTYPWGFPLLLAPVLALFGAKLLILKFVLTVCYAAFLIAFFFLCRTRLADPEALLLTAVFGVNPALLMAQRELLADIPFMLFSTLGLWLIEKYFNQEHEDRRGLVPEVALGGVVFLAVFMRSNGLLLLLALAAAQSMHLWHRATEHARPRLADLSAAIPYATVGLLFLLQAALFPTVPYPLVEQFASLSPASVWQHLVFYYWLPAGMFEHLLQDGRVIYLVVLAGFIINLSRRRRRDLPIHLYGLATVIFYILYPPTQGLRYIFPLLPLFVLFSFDGMQFVAERMKARQRKRALVLTFDMWAGLALFSLAACIQFAWMNMAADRYVGGRSDGAYSPGTSAMIDFVRERTPPDGVIIFFKPRVMRLRTDRDSYMTMDCQALPTADYVAIVKSNQGYDQIPPQDVGHCNPAVRLTPVYEKDDFVVYQIDPAP